MDPGVYQAIAEVAFRSAIYAVRTFRKGLNFSRDAERLVLRLEVERFRFQLWGENCGLIPRLGDDYDGSRVPGRLPPRLEPLCDVLRHQLEEIESLFAEHETLSERYGLAPTTEPPTSSDKLNKLVARMQRSFRRTRARGNAPADSSGSAAQETGTRERGDGDGDGDDDDDNEGETEAPEGVLSKLDINEGKHDSEENAPEPEQRRRRTSTWKKIRWSIKDLQKFEGLVAELERHVTRLNQLLNESAARASDDDVRVSIVVVGSAVDRESIDLVRAAVSADSANSLLRSGIERKALSADLPWLPPPPPPPGLGHGAPGLGMDRGPRLADFALPAGFERLQRFLAEKKAGPDARRATFLLERKGFDSDIDYVDKRRLSERIQRLVMLLARPKDPAFLTPQAEGYIHDPEHFCWWLVFRFSDDEGRQQMPALPPPPQLAPTPTPLAEPVSLRKLLDPQSKFRPPPLEQRYALASALSSTLSELYRSSWLHKGIRSDNVLFNKPIVTTAAAGDDASSSNSAPLLRSLLVCGFDYTRQESEWATIDKAREHPDVAVAIYRHPAYQGAAAQGYRMQYDLYSFGLVLVEIAFWTPLVNFLGNSSSSSSSKKPASGSASSNKKPSSTRVAAASLALGNLDAEVTLSRDIKVFHEPHAELLKRRVQSQVDSIEFPFRVGSAYQAAVKFCLEAADHGNAGGDGDPFAGDGGLALHPALDFYNRVVVPLARLAAASGV